MIIHPQHYFPSEVDDLVRASDWARNPDALFIIYKIDNDKRLDLESINVINYIINEHFYSVLFTRLNNNSVDGLASSTPVNPDDNSDTMMLQLTINVIHMALKEGYYCQLFDNQTAFFNWVITMKMTPKIN